MKKTLANLKKEESAIAAAFKEGMKFGGSMRQHLNNIRRHALYEAVDGCTNFTEYVKLKRLPMEPVHAYRLAACGEAEQYIENSHAREFSDRALTVLSSLRAVNPETGKKTHDIDVKKVRQVARKAVAHHEKTGEAITGKLVKSTIDGMPWSRDKPAQPLGEMLEKEIKRLGKWVVAFTQLDEDVFLDADGEYPGSVTRLAKAYSEVASLLRRKVKP